MAAAAVLSGKTGKILVVGVDQKPGDKLGQSVDGCGDMDGDGYPDFVSGGGVFGNPSVTAFSGKTGKPIWTWRSTQAVSDLGYVVRSGGIDVDRDGVPDVIAGAPGEAWLGFANVGAVYVFSGRDGSVIFRGVSSPLSGKTDFAWDIAAVGTQPGSPFPVFVVPESQKSSLRAYRGSPGGVAGFGTSCRGSLGTAPKIGMRDLGGKAARITVYDANPGSPAVLLVGLSRTSFGATPLPLALDPFGFAGCKLFTSIDLMLPTTTGSTGLSKGYASFDLPVSLAAAGKVTLHAQWLSAGSGKLHPGGISDAISWRMK